MQTQFAFFASIVFSLIAWGMVGTRYIWLELRLRPRAEALRPLLILHSFSFPRTSISGAWGGIA